ncbi:MAG: class I SAM-dependent methyltransferase [Candidatus Endonucleobacter bathymodioli]|uniref:Ribosomal RNA small subunit methyltransferase J n=1 Tax=Candidatus Endonucleibacter bathymodioli TaxID=539814 RepID=A0AA90NXA7_9GAMM|nr:class I SAM-dependent methyltransferase [Candidatus Endonucleobacter bathymodioli]
MNNDSLSHIAVAYVDSTDQERAIKIAKKWQLTYIGDVVTSYQYSHLTYLLVLNQHILELRKLDEPKLTGIKVDLIDGAAAHRRKFGGGRRQSIAKAIGLKHGFTPHVLDATAGLGRDAFVLACLGCKVTLMERMPIVAALLDEGLMLAQLNEDIKNITHNMQLMHASSISDMSLAHAVDVVYLDPMYPHKEKLATVKKEMRILQSLVGADNDADALLAPALKSAKYRVVVKRPSYASPLNNITPTTCIKMKNNRFDVYVKQSIPKSS